ncbi:hypothetical protein REB14_02330 [Chryseobacterium sp. ES2]|uniref:Uncharacterized protein n=1 Tax=Chryseobacterium metallicongregator TaxID=3073042 RepID=A0ABU1DZP8_9FLAO|nr:hypothetical protein [Chryseobacterium sp. ES2]MDR4951018.1 hypothetical protein [Chryseobacterium sp. ES2]
MKTKTNVFLDFDNTQFDGHLHNAVMKYTNKYQDNDLPGLTKDQLMKELMGKDPLTPGSRYAVQVALINAKNDAKEEAEKSKKAGKPEKSEKTFNFFDAKGLNEFVRKSKNQGVDVVVLTASLFPGAIKAVYETRGLTDLKDIPMIAVPISKDKIVMAKSKDAEIKKYEKAQKSRSKGLSTVHNIFVDDSKENIEVFNKSRNPDNIGILATKGIDLEKLITEVEKTLIRQATKPEQSKGKKNPPSVEEGLYANADQGQGIYANAGEGIYSNAGEGLYANAHEVRSGKTKIDFSRFTETQNKPEVAPKLPPKAPKLPARAPKVHSEVPPKGPKLR